MAQTFSRVLEMQGDTIYAQGTSVFSFEDEIICFHIKSVDGTSTHIGSTKLDTQGAIIDEQIIVLEEESLLENVELSPYSDEEYLVTVSVQEGSVETAGFLGYSHLENDSLWYVPFGIDGQIVKGIDVQGTTDGGYIFLVSSRPTIFDPLSYHLIRYDDQRQQQWIQQLDDQAFGSKFITDLEVINDSQWIVVGSSNNSTVQDSFYAFLDTSGELIELYNFGGEWNDRLLDVVTTSEKSIASGFYSFEDNMLINQCSVSMIDNESQNILWTSSFRPLNAEFSSFKDSKVLPSGDIISVGRAKLEEDQGLIVKHNGEGDVIWARILNCTENNSGFCNLQGISTTEDGSIIATGLVNDFPEGPFGTWILKLDSEGCLEPGCDNVAVSEEVRDKTLNIYPNPSTDLLFISSPDISGIISVDIYQANGEHVRSTTITSYPNEILNLSYLIKDLTLGLHIIKVNSLELNSTISSRFVKN